jgi:hypothetical protein
MKKIIFLVIPMALASLNSHADGYFLNNTKIEYLTITQSDAYFRGVGNTGDNPDKCFNTSSDKLAILPADHPRFKEVYSMLLSAQSAKRNVKVYVSGCQSRWGEYFPKVVTVHLLD